MHIWVGALDVFSFILEHVHLKHVLFMDVVTRKSLNNTRSQEKLLYAFVHRLKKWQKYNYVF